MVWEWDSVSVSALEKGAKHLAQMDHTNLQGLHFTYTPDMQVNFQQSQEFPGHTHLEAPSSRFWSVFFSPSSLYKNPICLPSAVTLPVPTSRTVQVSANGRTTGRCWIIWTARCRSSKARCSVRTARGTNR